MPFLITGLPRSRTAWMSVAATTGQSFCYHEPLSDLPRWQDVYRLWESDDYQDMGISDSALGFHLAEILQTAQPRTLVIDRPIPEVVASLEKIGIAGSERFCALLSRRINEAANNLLVRRVSFSSLSDDDVVAECLEYLMPRHGVDMQRIRQLQSLVIQPEMTRVLASARERASDVRLMLGDDVVNWLEECP